MTLSLKIIYQQLFKSQENMSNNGTNQFKETIKNYLDNKAEIDDLFRARYINEKKNIDDCVTYIINEVQKSGCNGFADDEIYSMAIHYYDEEDIEVGTPVNCKVVINQSVELTEEEKEEEKQRAIEEYRSKVIKEQKIKKTPKAKEVSDNQIMLFE